MRALVLKEIRSFLQLLDGVHRCGGVPVVHRPVFVDLPGAWNVLDSGMASMTSFFALAPWILMFLVPAVTMEVVCGGAEAGHA